MGDVTGVLRKVRRRPSGEPPPLSPSPGLTSWLWAALAVAVLGIALKAAETSTGAITDLDQRVLERFADLRSASLTRVADAVNVLTSVTLISVARWAVVIALVVARRFRHMFVFLATFVVSDWVVARLLVVSLPPPSVPALAQAGTYAFPSRSIAALGITLFAVAYVVLPKGAGRRAYQWAAHVVLLAVVLSQLYLATDYPVPMAYAWLMTAVVATTVFLWLVPEDVFPVTWGAKGKAAHLDVGGARGEAVVQAMREELGLVVTKVEPFGLEGSGGSSPLRMTLEDGTRVFGKIYSTTHVRADRWYRIGRTIMYGQLEDETPMGSVRRLVTSEDYALRFLDDNGVRIAGTYGIVELTPNEEYMLVTQFFEGGRNLDASEVDDTVIDEGLALVRRLWDVGAAHRDIKPANLLVVDGHLQLVDVSGLEIRPSPWREAVDLANMLLTLALRSTPEHVYERATAFFTPEEIGEAMACAEGLAIPTELSAKLRADGRPLLQRFRELAPPTPGVSIQRWSARRVVLTAVAFVSVLVLASLFVSAVTAGLN
ncbi:MAG: hypothetical protein ACM3OO_14295 [Planctomycetaceae bacterium]